MGIASSVCSSSAEQSSLDQSSPSPGVTQKISSKELGQRIERASKTGSLTLCDDKHVKRIPARVADELADVLRVLIMNNLSLTTISDPPGFQLMVKLKTLSLNRNLLTELGTEIGELKNLEVLHLDYNELTALPTVLFRGCGKLRQLTASHNALKEVPVAIGAAKQLEVLDLCFNPAITALPTEIGQVDKLCELTLTSNSLTALPDSMGNLKALQVCKLGNNRLSSLPPKLLIDTPVFAIELEGNPLYDGHKYYELPGFDVYLKRHKAQVDKKVAAGIHDNHQA